MPTSAANTFLSTRPPAIDPLAFFSTAFVLLAGYPLARRTTYLNPTGALCYE